MKIAIIGYSGSGKSTLTRKIALHYKIPFLFLDTVNFLPNWIERDRKEGASIVLEFMKNESWVIDGNYNYFFQEKRLKEADKIIFLDFPRRICICRVFKRYIKNRNKNREDMSAGCIEKFDLEFIWWILYKGRTKKKFYEYKNIEKKFKDKIIVMKREKDVKVFLEEMI